MGLHRMYLKSWWALLYLPFFIGVLYCNSQVRNLHEDVSRTYAALEQAQTAVKTTKPEDPATATDEDKKAYADAQADVKVKEGDYKAAAAVQANWYGYARWLGIVIALMLLVDAFLIPRLVRQRRTHAAEAGYATDPIAHEPEVHEQGTGEDPTMRMRTPFTDRIDRISGYIGEYVAYWAVVSVFVYYYEVLARFVFNSPTNWVHESMFLMYGMQYMLAGAYAYREDQHVRVDVLYTKLPPRGKAIADIISSAFFFIFTLTLLWTAWRFASDAIHNAETSFTEWGIQYWPVKLSMPIGAALIVLQGVAKLIKDILFVTRKGA